MNLDGLYSNTRVSFDPDLRSDHLILNGKEIEGIGKQRARILLDRVRELAGLKAGAWIESYNNFPTGTGIASSASGFAALALAASRAASLELSETELSRLARRASGSACRSIPGGFVEWQTGQDDESSYAFSLAPPEHWELMDCIAVISQTHKATTSQEGHSLADTSPLQAGRVADTPRRLEICRQAISRRDFEALAGIMELDSNLMHAVIMTCSPALFYWQPTTIQVMRSVIEWRASGVPACYTIDAGPNVHVICQADVSQQVAARLNQIEGVQSVLTARPGGPARLLTAAA
jgi:diphosphomevalonate decarboxylase